jgi:hypothetical protein
MNWDYVRGKKTQKENKNKQTKRKQTNKQKLKKIVTFPAYDIYSLRRMPKGI